MEISTSTNQSHVNFNRLTETEVNIKNIIISTSWSPAIYRNNYRKEDNFLRAELIGLDFDGGLSLEEAKKRFALYWHIIGTTKSHQKEKNGLPACDRFRVILKLNSTADTVKDYRYTVSKLLEENPEADGAAKDACRQFYPCVEIVSENYTGNTIQLLTAPEVKPKTVEPLTSFKAPLHKSTQDFKLGLVPVGERNNRLYKAARNYYQSGYSQEETIKDLEIAFDFYSHPRDKWIKTIESAFSKEPEYEPEYDELTKEALDLIVTPSDLIQDTFEYLQDKDKVKGQPTGLAGLDKLLGGGLRGGELIGLVAQAGAGKSSLLHKIQVNLSKDGLSSGYLSQEMNPYSEVIPNYLSILCQENAWKEDITPERKEKYMEALQTMKVFFTKERGHIPYEKIEAWMTLLNKSKGVNYFFLDHLAFCQKISEDYAEAAELIRNLKKLCTDLEVNMITIIQPQKLQFGQNLGLESMRGGAALNQACDMVITMERERGDSYADPTEAKNVSKLKTHKARHKLSKLGECFIKYNPITTDIEDAQITWEEKKLD